MFIVNKTFEFMEYYQINFLKWYITKVQNINWSFCTIFQIFSFNTSNINFYILLSRFVRYGSIITVIFTVKLLVGLTLAEVINVFHHNVVLLWYEITSVATDARF
jgi:hypothetical protein